MSTQTSSVVKNKKYSPAGTLQEDVVIFAFLACDLQQLHCDHRTRFTMSGKILALTIILMTSTYITHGQGNAFATVHIPTTVYNEDIFAALCVSGG